MKFGFRILLNILFRYFEKFDILCLLRNLQFEVYEVHQVVWWHEICVLRCIKYYVPATKSRLRGSQSVVFAMRCLLRNLQTNHMSKSIALVTKSEFLAITKSRFWSTTTQIFTSACHEKWWRPNERAIVRSTRQGT